MVRGKGKVHLDIVAPPNSDFIEGWPGIHELPEAELPGAAATGTVVVTPLTNKLVEASELRISLIKTETPFGPPNPSKHKQVVSEQQLWVRQNGALPEMEVGFRLPIPEHLPPSLQLGDKLSTGIFYELVAELDMPPTRTLCIRSSAPATLRKVSPLIIEKADLLPTWPIYTASGLSEERSSASGGRTFQLIARRPTTACGVGDIIEVPVHLRGATHFKLITLTMTLKEVTTIKPITGAMATSAPRPTTQSTKNIFERSFAVHQTIDPDEDHRFELREQIPPSHRRITCSGSQIQVGYHLRITASIEFSSRFGHNKTRDWTLEVDKLPVTVAGWGVDLAKAIMERILDERGGRMPAALQGQPQETSVSADAVVLPPSRRVEHPLRNEDATFPRPEPLGRSVQNTIPSAMGPASTVISDAGPQLRAPPPSLFTDSGRSRLNPAEFAYHNARLAEQSNNSNSEGTSSGSQRASRSQNTSARVASASIPEGDSKMTVANPDDGIPTSRPLPQPVPKPEPPARSLGADIKQEVPADEKMEYAQAQSSVEHVTRPRPALPEPYQTAADEKLMHQQDAYGARMGLSHTPNLYHGPQAENAAANAVTQFEMAVAARNDRMREMFGSEAKKDKPPNGLASASDEKAQLAAKYESRENGHHEPGQAQTTASSRRSSVDTEMRHERSLYDAALSERDRNYFANSDHATPTDKLRNMSRNHVQHQMLNSLPRPRDGSVDSHELQSRQETPQNFGRTSPPLPPGAASVRRAPSTRTTTTLHSTMLPTDENFASLYRDPSVKWGKQRAVSPPGSVASHGSSWHGGNEDSFRSPA